MYEKYFKRILDIFISGIGLIIFAIPMIIIAILIKIDSQGPILFKQKRLGKSKNYFLIYKFRTMCVNAFEMGGIVMNPKDKRITRLGSILRRTSLDELPQLINILKGDMSIIGPRPILDFEFSEFASNDKFNERFTILPGLFCTVDIHYRSSSDRFTQFSMDSDYTKEITFIQDLSIFFRVIITVISGNNVYRDEN